MGHIIIVIQGAQSLVIACLLVMVSVPRLIAAAALIMVAFAHLGIMLELRVYKAGML
jgi:hypothetical protein